MLSNRVDWRIFLFELKYPALGYKTVVNWSRPFFTIDNYNVYQFPISFAPSYPEPWSRPSSVKPSYQYHLELLSSLLIGLLSDMLPLSTWNKPEKGPLLTPPLFDTWSWNQYKAVFHTPPTRLRAATMDTRAWCHATILPSGSSWAVWTLNRWSLTQKSPVTSTKVIHLDASSYTTPDTMICHGVLDSCCSI